MQTLISLTTLLLLISAVSAAKPKSSLDEPEVHELFKTILVLLTGIAIGVIYESQMGIKDILAPLLNVAFYGGVIATAICLLFGFGALVSSYL